MQPLAVMLVRFVNAARQGLSQRIDRRDVVYVTAGDEAGNTAPFVYQYLAAETLEEIQNARVRFVFSEHLYRHRAGRMQVQRLRRMDLAHYLPQRLIRNSVDIHVCQRQTDGFACRIRQRTGMYEFGLDSFEAKRVVKVRPHAPRS